jgi:hypothetical protein
MTVPPASLFRDGPGRRPMNTGTYPKSDVALVGNGQSSAATGRAAKTIESIQFEGRRERGLLAIFTFLRFVGTDE